MTTNRIHEYQHKLRQDFRPLLPAQRIVAERIRQEMTKGVKASLMSLEAWKYTTNHTQEVL